MLFKKRNTNKLVMDKHLNLRADNLYNIRDLKDISQLENGINITYSDVANISLIFFFNLIKEMNKKFNETEMLAILKQLTINYYDDKELLEATNLILDISKE